MPLETVQLPAPQSPFGLCYVCLQQWAEKHPKPVTVQQAITLTPIPVPLQDELGNMLGVGVAAVPVCARHFPNSPLGGNASAPRGLALGSAGMQLPGMRGGG